MKNLSHLYSLILEKLQVFFKAWIIKILWKCTVAYQLLRLAFLTLQTLIGLHVTRQLKLMCHTLPFFFIWRFPPFSPFTSPFFFLYTCFSFLLPASIYILLFYSRTSFTRSVTRFLCSEIECVRANVLAFAGRLDEFCKVRNTCVAKISCIFFLYAGFYYISMFFSRNTFSIIILYLIYYQ